jgi:hypothetical protein
MLSYSILHKHLTIKIGDPPKVMEGVPEEFNLIKKSMTLYMRILLLKELLMPIILIVLIMLSLMLYKIEIKWAHYGMFGRLTKRFGWKLRPCFWFIFAL